MSKKTLRRAKRGSESRSEAPSQTNPGAPLTVALLEEARALPGGSLATLTLDPRLVLANARIGLEALRTALPSLRAQLKGWDEASLESYEALLTLFAEACRARDAARGSGNGAQLAAVTKEAWPLRRKLLLIARILVDEDLLRPTVVKAVARGGGPRDCGDDLEALARAFTDAWRHVQGKVPVTLAELDRARALSAQLLELARPSGQRRFASPEHRAALAQRDRLYTLLVIKRHELWPYAALAFGEVDVAERFPALGAQRRRSKRRRAGAAGEEGSA